MARNCWNWGLVLRRRRAQHLIRGRGGKQAAALRGLSRQHLGEAVGGFSKEQQQQCGGHIAKGLLHCLVAGR